MTSFRCYSYFIILSCMCRCYSAEVVIYLFTVWDGVQNSFPKMWQVTFSNISI